jgi:hypothetical protein
MAREFDPSRRPDQEVRRTVRRLVRDAIALLQAAIDESAPTTADEPVDLTVAVHIARRNCKEVRALIRLVTDVDHGPVGRLDRVARDAGRTLAPVRETHVAAAIAERTSGTNAGPGGPGTSPSSCQVPDEHRVAVEAAIAQLERALELTAEIRIGAPADALYRGLRHTYGRSRRAFERARRRPTPRRLHRWRTWNKRLWYQVRFLAVTAPSVLAPLADVLDLVGEMLGDVHDLDVFLAGDDASSLSEAQREMIERQRSELGERAIRWGATIHAEAAPAFAERLVRLWRNAAEQGPEPAR